MSELWFLADGDTIRLSLHSSRHKTKNRMRRPARGLLLLDLPTLAATSNCAVTPRSSPTPAYAFVDQVATKYGTDLRDMDQPGESRVVVTLKLTRVRAWG